MVLDPHPDLLDLELHRSGELDLARDERLASHLQECERCRVLSAGLTQAAGDLAAPALDIPTRVDDAIRARGRAAAVRGRRRRLWAKRARWAVPAAAAAAVVLAAIPWVGQSPSQPAAIARDVNDDGQTDVLDALALARSIDAGSVEATWDFNGDARVDGGDVEILAMAAVSLGDRR